MKNFSMIAKQFVNDESGQDLIEYALVAAIIGARCRHHDDDPRDRHRQRVHQRRQQAHGCGLTQP